MADTHPYYITTAISYPNDAPHIGHAYEAVATDALARFRRLQGRDVFFLTGTDEHGIKMLQTARAQGITAAELADRNTPKFLDMVRVLVCSNDDFISREPRHVCACQELWRRMQVAGDIYLGKYSGWYSVRDEAYYDESELKEAADGRKLSPQGTPVEWVEEESYFFKLSSYRERLLAYYDAHAFIGPDTRAKRLRASCAAASRICRFRARPSIGHPRKRPEAHHVCVWCAHQLSDRSFRFPDEGSESFRRWPPRAYHRQGHALPRRLLAGLLDVRE
jgi:methionyl-tRNA synthetase